MEHLCQSIIEEYQGSFHPVHLFDEIRQNPKTELIAKAEEYLGYSYPALPAVLYINFNRIGNRVDYETPYMARRCALNTLVIGEFMEQKGWFLDDIINGIFAICEESGWQLPAHNSYRRDAPQYPLPDSSRPVLDLFSCETGAMLAAIYSLLKPSLDQVSPIISSRIRTELEHRIIIPYLTEHFWWMGNGEEPMCNWTVWCTQNILLTASMLDLDEDVLQKIVHQSCTSIDAFLKDYGTDGCCDEGAQYYRHAGLCLYLSLFLLNQICEDAFVKLWENPKIKNIAEYISNVHAAGPYYINFSDCSAVAGNAGVREYLFGKAVHSEQLLSFAAADFALDDQRYLPQEINLVYRLLTIKYESEVLTYAAGHNSEVYNAAGCNAGGTNDADRNVAGRFPEHSFSSSLTIPNTVWYPSVGILIIRTPDTCLAVKAGDNDDSHNHNDTGSFILYDHGFPVLIDIGVETYTKNTFSDRRYDIWTMQSGYHNLPTINGMDQLPGPEYRATDIELCSAKDSPQNESSIMMELKEAYPSSCQIKSYVRKVSLSSQPSPQSPSGCCDYMMLTDHFIFEEDVTPNVIINLIAYEKPVYSESILSIGSISHFQVSGHTDCKIEVLPITDARLQTAWKHDLYRIRFFCTGTQFSLKTVL